MPTGSDWGEWPEPEDPQDPVQPTTELAELLAEQVVASRETPDGRQFTNVEEIRVEHCLHRTPRTIVRIISRELLEVGTPLYVDRDTMELTPHAGDRSRAGAGHVVGEVISVEHRRLCAQSRTMDGHTEVTHMGDEYRALVELDPQRRSPILLDSQRRPPTHVMDTETVRGPSPLAEGIRLLRANEVADAFGIDMADGLDRAIARTVRPGRPRPVTQDLKSDDPLED